MLNEGRDKFFGKEARRKRKTSRKKNEEIPSRNGLTEGHPK